MSIYEAHSTMTYHSLMRKSKSDLARMVLEYADMDATVLNEIRRGDRFAEALEEIASLPDVRSDEAALIARKALEATKETT